MTWQICMSPEGWSNVAENVARMASTDDGRETLAQAIANDAYQRADDMHGQSSREYILPDSLPARLAERMKHTRHAQHGYFRFHVRRGIVYNADMLRVVDARVKAEALTWDADTLTDTVIRQIEQHDTSTSGGHYVYADKGGFTLIPVDLMEDPNRINQ